MYDFLLGSFPKSFEEEARYLLSIKRLLPRWCNSIPDSEFLTVAQILHDKGKEAAEKREPLVAVETGVGACTLALIFYAMKHEGRAYSWDINAEKASEIRRAAAETMGMSENCDVNRGWRYVNYNSLSKHLGLAALKEWTDTVHYTMHDSEHVWNTLSGELQAIQPLLADGSVVALDDAYYTFLHTDEIYLNIQRKKLGLTPVEPLTSNSTRPHWQETEAFLARHWEKLTPVGTDLKKRAHEDLSIAYFNNDVEVRGGLGVTKNNQLENRFLAWRVSARRLGGTQ